MCDTGLSSGKHLVIGPPSALGRGPEPQPPFKTTLGIFAAPAWYPACDAAGRGRSDRMRRCSSGSARRTLVPHWLLAVGLVWQTTGCSLGTVGEGDDGSEIPISQKPAV